MNRLQKKNKRKSLSIILCAIVAVILAFLFRSCASELALSQYEEKVNQITEIDYSKQQEALDALVEEGKMNVNYSATAVFRGTSSERFNIKNIKNNHHPIRFQLLDEEGNCIYASKKIEPGYEMCSIELTEELPKGTHECKLKVGYAEEGNVSSVFPITIEVK